MSKKEKSTRMCKKSKTMHTHDETDVFLWKASFVTHMAKITAKSTAKIWPLLMNNSQILSSIVMSFVSLAVLAPTTLMCACVRDEHMHFSGSLVSQTHASKHWTPRKHFRNQ